MHWKCFFVLFLCVCVFLIANAPGSAGGIFEVSFSRSIFKQAITWNSSLILAALPVRINHRTQQEWKLNGKVERVKIAEWRMVDILWVLSALWAVSKILCLVLPTPVQDKLEQVQGLEHSLCEERLRKVWSFELEKGTWKQPARRTSRKYNTAVNGKGNEKHLA